ncbi:lateral flagellar export/assembly protein (FliP-like) [Escherichia coli]|nr:lateral flagellar export/assembly protein (FliP-like) [Escherichia coli]STM78683.1 lateral flagellar export/assembly protein (FliP-like) [Escherichia coli]
MLSPLIVSLPFKLMLFVLIDGWSLTIGTLTTSIRGLGLG